MSQQKYATTDVAEQEMTQTIGDSEQGDGPDVRENNALLHEGNNPNKKCTCHTQWDTKQFIFFCILVVILSAALGAIFSNIDRMVETDESSQEEKAKDYCIRGVYDPPSNVTQESPPEGWTWTYDPHNVLAGPGIWSTYYPQCACDTHQSPRDIDTVYAKISTPRILCDDNEHLLQWRINDNYTRDYNGTFYVKHSEHTIQMDHKLYPDDTLPPIAILDNLWQPANSTLHSQFRLQQIHFHWGSPENGSPHTLDGKHYPLCIHFVHYSADYESLGAAFGDWNNLYQQNKDRYILAVVGIFFEIDETNSSYIPAIDQLLSSEVLNSPNDEDTGYVEQINVTQFLPHGPGDYYYYEGSMTTPPCIPIVRWHLLANPLKVNRNQITKFKNLANETISYNTRSVQTNTAPVYACHADFFPDR